MSTVPIQVLTKRSVPPLRLVLDARSGIALHRQLAEQVRRAILERRLRPGQRLPSSRLMAAELDVARGTVLQAMDQLVSEGYLVSRAGSGLTVVPNVPDDMLSAPRPEAARARPAGAASVTAPTAPELSRRARVTLDVGQVVREGSALSFPVGKPDHDSFPYPLWGRLLEREWRRPSWQVAGALHPFGHPGLRAAIATYLGVARGFACDPRAIVVTSGMAQSLSLLAWLVLDPGDAAWVEDPGYSGVQEALASVGVKSQPVAIDTDGFDVARAMAVAPQARLAVVAPAHQYPLGTPLTLQRRLELLAWAERSAGWIAEDDYDGEYRYAGRPVAPLRALDRNGRVAYLAGFSKLLFPALRLSFIVLPDGLVTAAEKRMSAPPVRTAMLGQGALARFILDGYLASHLRRTRTLYQARQEALLDSIGRHLGSWLVGAPSPGGMHLVAQPVASLASRFRDGPAISAAAQAGVTLAPLSACYAGPQQRHGLIMGYAAAPERVIDASCATLARVLERMPVPHADEATKLGNPCAI